MTTIYIVACNLTEAAGVAMRMGLKRPNWKFVGDPRDFRGIAGICVLRARGWDKHPRAGEISEVMWSANPWIWEER